MFDVNWVIGKQTAVTEIPTGTSCPRNDRFVDSRDCRCVRTGSFFVQSISVRASMAAMITLGRMFIA